MQKIHTFEQIQLLDKQIAYYETKVEEILNIIGLCHYIHLQYPLH